MKQWIVFFVGFVAGVGIGWYLAMLVELPKVEREMSKNEQAFEQDVAKNAMFVNTRLKEYSRAAKPWEASTASIALVGLKDLETTNIENAKFRFAAMAATYYRAHLHDGDTNLLAQIKSCAATNAALSNAIFRMPH